MPDLPRRVYVVAGMAGLALIVGLLMSNFIGGETKIERRIERLHALDDPRFTHEMGVLLGPPFLSGNKVSALLNGDQIFPPMLAAMLDAGVQVFKFHPAHWRDTHFQVEGPAVAQMQSVFIDNWIKVTGDVLSRARRPPPLRPIWPCRIG